MAKTRIKTTPTRLQKTAMMATIPVTVAEDTKKRLRPPTVEKQKLNATSTIIVPAHKRANSISSATSSISHTSDTHSAHSDTESASPFPLPTITNTTNLCSSLLCKPTNPPQGSSLKIRKVFMITEKCEESKSDSSSVAAQKRKMYLIMEENGDQDLDAQKYLKSENSAPKKLTLFADKSDGELSERFEKILPEILNRIQAKSTIAKQSGTAAQFTPKEGSQSNERLPITLPPKKNRNKILPIHVQSNTSCTHKVEDTHNTSANIKPTSAATPVIVSAGSLKRHNNICNGQSTQVSPPQLAPQKNINLSTDFLFLMKMLPRLESIPEPQKNQVKNCIEKIISQNTECE